MKKIVRLILYLLTSLVILLLIITFVFAYNKQYAKLTYFLGYTGFINTGTSMLPDIEPGDLIIVKKEKTYYDGDIISFANDENYITTHRIIEKKNNAYVTQGDNNSFVDRNEVSFGQIYGKLMWIIPNVDKFIQFFWTYKYLIIALFVVAPGMLMLIQRGKHVR